jgi:hypothetical protein
VSTSLRPERQQAVAFRCTQYLGSVFINPHDPHDRHSGFRPARGEGPGGAKKGSKHADTAFEQHSNLSGGVC